MKSVEQIFKKKPTLIPIFKRFDASSTDLEHIYNELIVNKHAYSGINYSKYDCIESLKTDMKQILLDKKTETVISLFGSYRYQITDPIKEHIRYIIDKFNIDDKNKIQDLFLTGIHSLDSTALEINIKNRIKLYSIDWNVESLSKHLNYVYKDDNVIIIEMTSTEMLNGLGLSGWCLRDQYRFDQYRTERGILINKIFVLFDTRVDKSDTKSIIAYTRGINQVYQGHYLDNTPIPNKLYSKLFEYKVCETNSNELLDKINDSIERDKIDAYCHFKFYDKALEVLDNLKYPNNYNYSSIVNYSREITNKIFDITDQINKISFSYMDDYILDSIIVRDDYKLNYHILNHLSHKYHRLELIKNKINNDILLESIIHNNDYNFNLVKYCLLNTDLVLDIDLFFNNVKSLRYLLTFDLFKNATFNNFIYIMNNFSEYYGLIELTVTSKTFQKCLKMSEKELRNYIKNGTIEANENFVMLDIITEKIDVYTSDSINISKNKDVIFFENNNINVVESAVAFGMSDDSDTAADEIVDQPPIN